MGWLLNPSEFNIVTTFLSLFMVLFMLVSCFIQDKILMGQAPVAFIVGIIFGPRSASLIDPLVWSKPNTVTLEFSRLVLAVQCFGNAIELPNSYLERHTRSLAYIIGPVMLGGWLITTCCVKFMVPEFDWPQALACSACFNAIDPVLAGTILTGSFSKRIPKHLRDLLQTEAAVNGVTTTLVLDLTTDLLQYPHSPGTVARRFFSLGLAYEVIFGTIAGIGIGYLARWILRTANRLNTIDRPAFLAYYLSIALLSTGFGTFFGVDEVNLAFFAGIGLDNDGWYERKTEESFFASCIDLLLNLGYFAFVGALVPWSSFSSETLSVAPWRLVLGTLLIFLFRRFPMVLLFKGFVPDLKTWREASFYGHFGPIGAGALFSALIIRGKLTPGSDEAVDVSPTDAATAKFLDQLWTVSTFVVLCSSIVHGTSITIFSLGRRIKTMTLTMTYTQDDDRTPSWMDRLPRIAAEGGPPSLTPRISASKDEATVSMEQPISRENEGIVEANGDSKRGRGRLHRRDKQREKDSWGYPIDSSTTVVDRGRRGTAHAYQFGHTIIVEDDAGDVIKEYNMPSTPDKPDATHGGFFEGFGTASRRLSPRRFVRQLQELEPDRKIRRVQSGERLKPPPPAETADERQYDYDTETAVERRRRLSALGSLTSGSNKDRNQTSTHSRAKIDEPGTVDSSDDTAPGPSHRPMFREVIWSEEPAPGKVQAMS